MKKASETNSKRTKVQNRTRSNGADTKVKPDLTSRPVSSPTRPKDKPVRLEPQAPSRKQPRVVVQDVSPGEVIALVLRELTTRYSSFCNFGPEAKLAERGDYYLAYLLVQEKCSAIAETSAERVWVKAQAQACFKKVYDPAVDRWAAAKASWFADERTVGRTNRKIRAMIARYRKGQKPLPYEREIVRTREFLQFTFGSHPDLKEIAQLAHNGPGSTVDVSGSAVHYGVKRTSLSCTSAAMELASDAMSYDKAAWVDLGMDPTYAHLETAQEGFRRVAREAISSQLVSADKLLFVFKGIDSLRSIGAQPTLNVALQLGTDVVMKRALARVSVDLSDQSWNQHLARYGSERWEEDDPYCTLDKSSASNLVARELIGMTFPAGWALLLNKLRVSQYVAPKEFGGGTFTYEMYAGMGNGTTFSVESALFAALAYASSDAADVTSFIRKREFAVYGDDVILRRAHARRYMALAQYLGFRFNTKKTFLEGPFRESCGADFWKGVNVRPAYVKCETRSMFVLNMIGVHNTLVDHPEFNLPNTCQGIRSLFSRKIHFNVPTDPLGNTGFRPCDSNGGYTIVRDRATGAPILSEFWQRPRFYYYQIVPKFDEVECVGGWIQFVTALAGGSQRGFSTKAFGFPLRKAVNITLVAERDMERRTMVRMLSNQLARLAVRKNEPWYAAARGQFKS